MTKYNHHKKTSTSSSIREVVFGMEDGMVSTLGAITGIAIGSQDQYTIVLAGVIIVAVESISMSIGSYISNRSENEIDQRKIEEEKEEIADFPVQEKKELLQLFIRDGWPNNLAKEMSETAAKEPNLMLTEMTYRELLIKPGTPTDAFRKGFLMFISYTIGGMLPLLSYLILPIKVAMPISVGITLIGLFGLGAATTKYSKVSWLKAGGRVLLLGIIALVIGYVIGEIASYKR